MVVEGYELGFTIGRVIIWIVWAGLWAYTLYLSWHLKKKAMFVVNILLLVLSLFFATGVSLIYTIIFIAIMHNKKSKVKKKS